MILKDVEPFEAYGVKPDDCKYEGNAFFAYVAGVQSLLEKLDSAPEIDPESLPVVQQLRAEVERLNKGVENLSKNVESAYKQRDAAIQELEGADLSVGDRAWKANDAYVFEVDVRRLIYDCGCTSFDGDDIGETVFRTKDEAEAALAKMREEGRE